MTRPGDRLRALAARMFDAQTMERLVDQVVADLQAEHEDAIHAGRIWRGRWLRIAGYVAFVKVVAVCGWRRAVQGHRGWTSDDRLALIRVIVFSAIPAVAITLLLELAPSAQSLALRSVDLRLLLYLMPQALTLAVPVGATLGILFGLRSRTFSRRLMSVLLALALICSAVSLGNLGWIVPLASQAFRLAIYGHADLLPGAHELLLGDLSRQIESSRHGDTAILDDVRNLAFADHYRWVFSCAPLVLALLALSIVARRPVARLTMGLAAFCVFLSYYVLLFRGRTLALTGIVPAYAGAWLPNVLFVLISVAVAMTLRQSSSSHHVTAGGRRPSPSA